MKMSLAFLITTVSFLMIGCKTNETVDSSISKNVELYPVDKIQPLPYITVISNPKTISSSELRTHIYEHAKVEWLAEDSIYFLPTEENMTTVINYLDAVFRKFGIYFIPEGLDCDDFAIILWGKFHEKFGNCSVGFATSNEHAFNFFIDENKKLWIIEPQNDTIFITNESKYKIKFAII